MKENDNCMIEKNELMYALLLAFMKKPKPVEQKKWKQKQIEKLFTETI